MDVKTNAPDEAITLEDILRPLKKRWYVIVLLPLLAAALALPYSLTLKKKEIYRARTFIQIGSDRTGAYDSPNSIRTIMTTTPMLASLALDMSLEPSDQNIATLKKKIDYIDNSGFLEIAVTDDTAERAKKTVDMVSKKIYAKHEEIYKKSRRENEEIKKLLQNRFGGLLIGEKNIYGPKSTQTIVPTFCEDVSIMPDRKQPVLMAFVAGLFISLGYVLFLESGMLRSKYR